ncbi:alpha/beta fold hydrolase [Bordetella sp. N]|uniref:alpha/beta fold hydrolase n=1 Tax=Bordetella sp. N TaxID=1746199 RepID=UPI00070A24A6|nr:alpha/beta hydrolase [Bordetella sp. N]ALM82985.1 alpha/beta hydrolase [Bordetella sp. N]
MNAPHFDALGTPIRRGHIDTPQVRLAYEDWGDPHAPPLLLIMGLGAQMLLWPDGFCRRLVEAGFRVIRYDNRDIGLSGRIRSLVPPPNLWWLIARAQLGMQSKVPYTLEDMADDTAALLDGLGLEQAHVVGGSMGGMIAQVFAGRYPARVASLAVIFSSTCQPFLPPTAPSLLWKLLRKPRPETGLHGQKAHVKALFQALGSAAYPVDEAEMDALIDRLGERGIDGGGARRQLMALLGTGDLRRYAQRIQARTCVIHGAKDRMLPPAAGRAVARAILGAEFHLIAGMGHDLPRQLWPLLTRLIACNALPVTRDITVPDEHAVVARAAA